jgi:pimeloyl-ACP methyl ester carboxylesterase
VAGIEKWWSEGERVPLRFAGSDRYIFVRRMGAGPAMTLLHGYPSSSHDWAKVAPVLAEHHALLMPDFLGFGASDKPPDHDYTISEQADLVEALWEQDEIDSTVVVAHDYAVSVAQELLARHARRALAVDITRVHFLNGGLYPDLHRPQPAQTALLDPELGPQISAALTKEVVVKALEPTFADSFDAASDSEDIWKANSRDGGHLIAHRLIRYLTDQKLHGERWVAALEETTVPVAFVWGMLDPVSGAHMAKRIRERLPAAPFLALDDVGHWPQVEAPERVAGSLLASM